MTNVIPFTDVKINFIDILIKTSDIPVLETIINYLEDETMKNAKLLTQLNAADHNFNLIYTHLQTIIEEHDKLIDLIWAKILICKG